MEIIRVIRGRQANDFIDFESVLYCMTTVNNSKDNIAVATHEAMLKFWDVFMQHADNTIYETLWYRKDPLEGWIPTEPNRYRVGIHHDLLTTISGDYPDRRLSHGFLLKEIIAFFVTQVGDTRVALAISEYQYEKLDCKTTELEKQCATLNAKITAKNEQCAKLHEKVKKLRASQSKSAEFDKGSPTYPPELATALDAWCAVSAIDGKGKPKARIQAWLEENTRLSEKAKERIAVVCNWEKQGGASLSE